MGRAELIEQYAQAYEDVKSAGKLNTDFMPGEKVRWILPGRTRALRRGEIAAIHSRVYFEDGVVCYFGVKVDFVAPGWQYPLSCPVEEIQRLTK